VNDRLDVACCRTPTSPTSGPEDSSQPPQAVGLAAGRLLIGYSTHAPPARRGRRSGRADYIGFGPVSNGSKRQTPIRPSASKPCAPSAPSVDSRGRHRRMPRKLPRRRDRATTPPRGFGESRRHDPAAGADLIARRSRLAYELRARPALTRAAAIGIFASCDLVLGVGGARGTSIAFMRSVSSDRASVPNLSGGTRRELPHGSGNLGRAGVVSSTYETSAAEWDLFSATNVPIARKAGARADRPGSADEDPVEPTPLIAVAAPRAATPHGAHRCYLSSGNDGGTLSTIVVCVAPSRRMRVSSRLRSSALCVSRAALPAACESSSMRTCNARFGGAVSVFATWRRRRPRCESAAPSPDPAPAQADDLLLVLDVALCRCRRSAPAARDVGRICAVCRW